MKNIIRFICFALICATVASCTPDNHDPSAEQIDFQKRTDYGVYSGNNEKLVYAEATHQLYFSPTKHSTRILKDDLSAYATVTFDEEIAAGKAFKGSIKLHGISEEDLSDLDLNVLKIDDKKAWIWYEKGKTGYLMPWDI